MNTVHDTENEIIERRTKSEINKVNSDDSEINNNNHSFYLLNDEDKRDKSDNEMHSKLTKISRKEDFVMMRSDKIENKSKMENQQNSKQLNELQISIDEKDKIGHDESQKEISESIIEIGDEKEIHFDKTTDASDSEILKTESNVSAVNNSITSSSQISNDTSTSKTAIPPSPTPLSPLLIGESFFHAFNYNFFAMLLLFLAACNNL